MTSIIKKRSAGAILSLTCLILIPLLGSQDPSMEVAETLGELGSQDWDSRKRAVGRIKVDLNLLDDQEIQKALLGTCRNLLDILVSESDHIRHDQLLRDIVYLVRRLRSPEALPCAMDLPMGYGWISVSWIREVVGNSFDSIIKLLERGNVTQKSNAVRALSSLHLEMPTSQKEIVKEVLIRYVDGDTENPDVRSASIYGLVVYPEAEVVELLEKIAREDAVWHMINGRKRYLIREAAVEALQMIRNQ